MQRRALLQSVGSTVGVGSMLAGASDEADAETDDSDERCCGDNPVAPICCFAPWLCDDC